MKKLFRNIVLLLLIYIAISQLAVNSLPFSWGNTRLNTKYEEYKSHIGDFNTIFIGASTTYRHIDPVIFDNRLQEKKPEWQIHSFNFGIPANRTPQSIYALRNLIDLKGNDIRYIVLDLSELTKMGVDNLHKKEMIYWYTRDNIASILETSYESEKGTLNKIVVPALHLFSYGEKLLMVGMGSAMLEQHAGLNIEELALGPDRNGYYSLDQEMVDDPNGDLAVRYDVLRTQDTIDYRTMQCQKLYDQYKDKGTGYSKTMEKELEDLIRLCDQKGIHMVIMLSQRLGDRYEYLIPLYNRLPEANKVSFANPAEYPELNDRNNLFDLAHLNRQGSMLFTDLFADKFIEKVEAQEGADAR